MRRQDPAGLPADEAAYHRRIRLRRFDRPSDEDPVVFGADRDKASIFSVDTESSGRWLIVHSQVGTQHSNEVWLADVDAGVTDHPGFVPVITDRYAETGAHVGEDGRLYLLTDLGAARFRLAVTHPRDPGVQKLDDVDRAGPHAVLKDVAVLDRVSPPVVLALHARHAISEISVHDLRTGELRSTVPLPVAGTVSQLLGRYGGGQQVWFDLTSFDSPSTRLGRSRRGVCAGQPTRRQRGRQLLA